jgi:hypothetical protein
MFALGYNEKLHKDTPFRIRIYGGLDFCKFDIEPLLVAPSINNYFI